MSLLVSPPLYLDAFEIEDASITWQSQTNHLIATNSDIIFTIDLENAFCSVIAERNALQSWVIHCWRYHLPCLLGSESIRIVCADQFGVLMQRKQTDSYWICSESRKNLLQPLSKCREIPGVNVLDAKFLRGANESIVFLFDNQELVIDPCQNWFKSEAKPYRSTTVASEKKISNVLTDSVRNVFVYGERDLAAYSFTLQLKWKIAFSKNLICCWLSRCTFWVFCLFIDGLIQSFERDTGKLSIAVTGWITGIPTSPNSEPSALRDWRGSEISKNTRVFPKNSTDGEENCFYIVSQPENSHITQIHEVKVVNL